jgi:membrane glycosyltransferase
MPERRSNPLLNWLDRPRACRTVVVCGTILIGAAMTVGFAAVVGSASPSWLRWTCIVLMACLASWIGFGFTTAMLGMLVQRFRPLGALHRIDQSQPLIERTAVLMPVYNEDPAAVFAGLQATAESVAQTGQGNAFEFYILSDSTDPERWVAEELAWTEVRNAVAAKGPAVYYRHRTQNRGRKTGNLAEFLTRWGSRYKYFLVLDADSVMDGASMVELVRRMESDARLGLLQTPPRPVERESLWARCQQFAAYLYGPLFTRGLIAWCGSTGNFYGHNAIIRTEAFLRHCGLSKLPGREPLGGEVLSHDFVEAALLRRAGWHVRFAPDLTASYEQCPTTVIDYAKRDHRWCQGNLQHIQIALGPGYHAISRTHLLAGALSYLMSPLWLTFIVLSLLLYALQPDGGSGRSGLALGLFMAAMGMLLLPKFVAVWQARRRRSEVQQLGGMAGLFASALLESVVSALIAPVMLLFHSISVFMTVIGKKVRWTAQQRDDGGLSIDDAFRAHGMQMLLGIIATAATVYWTPALLPWLLPLLIGLVLVVPLTVLLANPTLGRWISKRGLLRIPEEVTPPLVLRRRATIERQLDETLRRAQQGPSLFARTITEPALQELHQQVLAVSGETSAVEGQELQTARRNVRDGSVDAIPQEMRRRLLGDPHSLAELHRTHFAEAPLDSLTK